MKEKAIFYHAGCPVCMSAEETVVDAMDPDRFDIEVVHLGEKKDRVSEAEGFGVKSVPALVLHQQPFHINFGADIADLR